MLLGLLVQTNVKPVLIEVHDCSLDVIVYFTEGERAFRIIVYSCCSILVLTHGNSWFNQTHVTKHLSSVVMSYQTVRSALSDPGLRIKYKIFAERQH